jgi:hypothetical protein
MQKLPVVLLFLLVCFVLVVCTVKLIFCGIKTVLIPPAPHAVWCHKKDGIYKQYNISDITKVRKAGTMPADSPEGPPMVYGYGSGSLHVETDREHYLVWTSSGCAGWCSRGGEQNLPEERVQE